MHCKSGKILEMVQVADVANTDH